MHTIYQHIEFKALMTLTGKWKMTIIREIGLNGTARFGEIRANIPTITAKMLATRLQELEQDGVIIRKAYAVVPLRVEYSLTPKGEALCPVLRAMRQWEEV